MQTTSYCSDFQILALMITLFVTEPFPKALKFEEIIFFLVVIFVIFLLPNLSYEIYSS